MSLELLEALAQGTVTPDEAHGRIYGWIPGTVTDVESGSSSLCRVKARIGKQGDNESTDWLIPMFMGAVESVPKVNEKIGVLFHDGDVHRGAYFCFPQSTAQGRPKESMVLGTSFMALFNYLVSKYNDLATQFNQLKSDYGTHTHPYTYGTTSSPTSPTTANNGATDVGSAQDANGSTVGSKSSSVKVLSGVAVVR